MRRFSFFVVGILIGAIPAVWAFHRIVSFPDVPENEWYAEAVNELAERGIFSGYLDGTFRPDNFVNRAELAVTLQQLLRQIPNLQSAVSDQQSNITVNATYNTPLTRALAFFTNRLSTSNGAIRSTLGADQPSSQVIGVNDEVLSESLGLAFNALAYAGERELFSSGFRFFKQHMLASNNFAVWKLHPDLSPYELANATIDDLRIVKGLLRGYERFGVAEYRRTALAMANALKQYATRDNVLVSHVSWNQSGRIFTADRLILGYADLEAVKMLIPYDQAWSAILTNTARIVKDGQLSNGLFATRYVFSGNRYEREDSLQSIFQAYALEHLAAAGENDSAQKLLNFFKREWTDRGKIFARYTEEGESAVSYEELATYAILARAALILNENTFASQLIGKILDLQITNTLAANYGAFLWSDNELVYAFSQLNALHSAARFRETDLQPSAPPQPTGASGSNAFPPSPLPPGSSSAPSVIGSQNYVVWHMADVYYGPQHDDEFTAMVNDMDTVEWDDAVVAGDIAGNGSAANFTNMKNIILTQSSHPWSDFHFVAGNHEYSCDGAPAQGCLDNYKSIVNPELRYTFDVGNIHFIMMSWDAEKYLMSNETMEWFRNEVAANQDKIIVAVTHPRPSSLGRTTPRAQAILNEFGIDLWLFGHSHCKHGDSTCSRHSSNGDFYRDGETTLADAGYIGNMESRYIIFTEGSNEVRILSRYHKDGGKFQPEFEHTATLRHAFQK